ncbi:PREDICTED: MD-2-related lipid-recognition protein-like [Papilio polytes]|uniref:MD-2-related lipid-recognition protein-like n=1 Tax=Papilio polytes TaxID=76194 RepID=UPI000675FE5F|nr:PREDICTED: MD-2-related lipid-recognition protein-like [Papilio polytes]
MLRTIVLLSLAAAALGTVIKIDKCEKVPEDVCTISESRISPCVNGNECKLKKGKEHAISFDFTPNFSAEKLKTAVYYVNRGMDIPFAELNDADGCLYTTCPVAPGVPQQLNYKLRLSKKLPSGNFPIKWRVWNEANPAQECCFLAHLAISRR